MPSLLTLRHPQQVETKSPKQKDVFVAKMIFTIVQTCPMKTAQSLFHLQPSFSIFTTCRYLTLFGPGNIHELRSVPTPSMTKIYSYLFLASNNQTNAVLPFSSIIDESVLTCYYKVLLNRKKTWRLSRKKCQSKVVKGKEVSTNSCLRRCKRSFNALKWMKHKTSW